MPDLNENAVFRPLRVRRYARPPYRMLWLTLAGDGPGNTLATNGVPGSLFPLR